jgi:hypothetical protein
MSYPPGLWEEAYDLVCSFEYYAAMDCCTKQHAVVELCTAYDKAQADLEHYRRGVWSYDQAWVNNQAKENGELWRKMQIRYRRLIKAVITLGSKKACREGAERGLTQAYESKREAGQQLSADELATSRRFGRPAPYAINHNGGMTGLFKLDRNLDTTSLIRDRLEGSSLFENE